MWLTPRLAGGGPQDKYYLDKLGVSRADAEERRRVVACYVEGLHWVLEYYYRRDPASQRTICFSIYLNYYLMLIYISYFIYSTYVV